MLGEGSTRVRYGNDRYTQPNRLVEQAQSQRVAGSVRPFVERIECAGRHDHGVRWREDVGLVGLLVVMAHDVPGQLGKGIGVHELQRRRGGDDADLPAVRLQRRHERR